MAVSSDKKIFDAAMQIKEMKKMWKKRKQMKNLKFRLPFSSVLTYCLLFVVLLIGFTVSNYVTGTKASDSARVAYIKDIEITETGNFTEPNKWIMTPGVDMTKNAEVHFKGSEMACYIFLKVEASNWRRLTDYKYAYPIKGVNALSFGIETDWTYLLGGESESVYYRIVKANDPLSASVLADNGKITVSENLTRTQLKSLPNLSIKISAIAVQYHGFSSQIVPGASEKERATAAWNAVKDK